MKHSINKLNTMIKTMLFTSLCAASIGVYGDDTEVFFSVNVSKPNLLFVLDVSGSMNSPINGEATGEPSEINTTITNGADDSYQSRFNGNRTSGSQVIDISSDTVPRFRFADVGVPQGAEITAAYIQFTSANADTGAANFNIYIDNSSNAPEQTNVFNTPLTQAANEADRIWTTNEAWQFGDRGDRQKTRDLTELVQFIVGKNDWDAGNAMGFYLVANDTNRRVGTAENPNLAAPELHISYTPKKTRLQVMQESLRVVLDEAPDNVQVGLMNYGQSDISPEFFGAYEEKHRHHSVSGVAFPIADINEKVNTIITSDNERFGLPSVNETVTVREYIADIADDWQATSFTPIVDALYEAALYYRGEKMHYGQRDPLLGGAHPKTHYGSPVTLDISDTNGPGRDNATAPQYRTPIESSCQDNYIVLMTDGAPTYLYNRNGEQSREPGPLASINGQSQGPQGTLASAITGCANATGVSTQGNCGAELTNYLANNDNLPDPSASFPDGQEGIQDIRTYTIGFGVNDDTEDYLKSLATVPDAADNGFFNATNPEELAAAFRDIIEDVAEPSGTLASPGYSVNVRSGLEHEKDIYIPVFDRRNTSRWAGNLKKFKLVDDNNQRKIRGSNGLDAVDELGGFSSNALDFWSSSPASDPDGGSVQRGGLANLLDPATRNIVSDIVSNNLSTDVRNKLVVGNNALTNDILGLPTTADATADLEYRNTIINFMRGWEGGDASSDDRQPRYHMGDMLHSEPVVLTYDDGESTGSSGSRKQYIFAGTNEGYLHAFDTSDTGANAGKEMFAFIPKELLGTLSEHQFLNSGSEADHKYGIDGSISFRFIDMDKDGIVDPVDDKVILYFGMRRGGSSYYALDVTNITKPKLLWKVTKSSDSSNPLYRMGQSWSAPYLARVGVDDSTSTCRISSTVQKTHCREVVIVTGGYDLSDDRDRTFCANENGTCTIPNNESTTVWYGANNTWVSRKNVIGSIGCNNSVFGDPLPGVVKSCHFESNSGEYDSTLPITASVGNDVFIFDANDGSLVWSLPSSEQLKLTNSIPGGVRILDTNSNSLIDRMYFGDTGGNLWRLDLSERITSSDNISKLNKLADLSDSGTQARKFYNEPDVAILKINGKTKYLVSIGSGFRAHPLDTAIEDKFFMVIDNSPFSPIETSGPNAFTSTTISQLAKINVSANSVTQTGSIKDGKGWVVKLATTGEKVLATSVTVDGVVLFTTLVPEVLTSGVGIDQCAAPSTQGRLYAIDVLSGGKAKDPLAFEDDSGTPGGTGIPIGGGGIFTTVSKGEIPGKPQAIFNSLDVNDTTGECRHPVDVRIGKKLSQATGYEACRLESIYWSDPETN